MIIQHTLGQYAMDGILFENMNKAKDLILDDWDMIFLVDGLERTGKSVLAQQIAYYLDPTFNLDRICFSTDELKRCIINAQPYQALIFDEAFTGLSSKASMSKESQELIQVFAEMGQKNLFLLIVMPTFYELNRYVAIHRSRALIHVYSGSDPKQPKKDGFVRGFFTFYDRDKKIELYANEYLKKHYRYKGPGAPIPNFYGRFVGFYTVDQAAYREKKATALKAREKGRDESADDKRAEELLFKRVAGINHPLRVKLDILNMPESTFFYKLKKLRELEGFSKENDYKLQTPKNNILLGKNAEETLKE